MGMHTFNEYKGTFFLNISLIIFDHLCNICPGGIVTIVIYRLYKACKQSFAWSLVICLVT